MVSSRERNLTKQRRKGLFLLLLVIGFGLGSSLWLFLLVGGSAAVVIANGSLVINGVVSDKFLQRGSNTVPVIVQLFVVTLMLFTPIDELSI